MAAEGRENRFTPSESCGWLRMIAESLPHAPAARSRWRLSYGGNLHRPRGRFARASTSLEGLPCVGRVGWLAPPPRGQELRRAAGLVRRTNGQTTLPHRRFRRRPRCPLSPPDRAWSLQRRH